MRHRYVSALWPTIMAALCAFASPRAQALDAFERPTITEYNLAVDTGAWGRNALWERHGVIGANPDPGITNPATMSQQAFLGLLKGELGTALGEAWWIVPTTYEVDGDFDSDFETGTDNFKRLTANALEGIAGLSTNWFESTSWRGFATQSEGLSVWTDVLAKVYITEEEGGWHGTTQDVWFGMSAVCEGDTSSFSAVAGEAEGYYAANGAGSPEQGQALGCFDAGPPLVSSWGWTMTEGALGRTNRTAYAIKAGGQAYMSVIEFTTSRMTQVYYRGVPPSFYCEGECGECHCIYEPDYVNGNTNWIFDANGASITTNFLMSREWVDGRVDYEDYYYTPSLTVPPARCPDPEQDQYMHFSELDVDYFNVNRGYQAAALWCVDWSPGFDY